MQTLLVHFDVPENQVRLDAFVQSALAARKSVEAVNRILFEGKFEFEIVVVAPRSGSLKQVIGVTLKIGKGLGYTYGIIWSLIQLLDSDTVQEVSRELLGKEPSELIVEKIEKIRRNYSEEDMPQEIDEDAKIIIEQFVTSSARSGLELQPSQIKKMHLPEDLKLDLLDAQADLYSGALDDPNILGLGFSEEEDFPIPRNRFAERAIRPERREEDEAEDDWIVSIRDFVVTSPQFEQDDQVARKWKARDASGSYVLFKIIDEEFWYKFKAKEIEFGQSTMLKVQLATCKPKRGRPTHKVIRVLEVDEEKIGSELPDEAITAIIGPHSKARREADLLDFFRDLDT